MLDHPQYALDHHLVFRLLPLRQEEAAFDLFWLAPATREVEIGDQGVIGRVDDAESGHLALELPSLVWLQPGQVEEGPADFFFLWLAGLSIEGGWYGEDGKADYQKGKPGGVAGEDMAGVPKW